MPEGGKATPIAPGLIARLSQATRNLSNAALDTWFGPMKPIQPVAPRTVVGRKFDYSPGYNLTYTPRANEPVKFNDLRALADNCDILRSVIETRKDQMEALDWNIRVKSEGSSEKRPTANRAQQKRIDAITEFFQYPDKRNNWHQWLRSWLEDMFVIDAASFYKRRDKVGRLWGLEQLDGASISIKLNGDGRVPLPPEVAYQQILHGVPATDYAEYGADEEGKVGFDLNELLYMAHNPRPQTPYGYSHVEQIILTANIAIRRALFQMDYYREGSQPDAFMGLPKEWSTDQIVQFQNHFDSMMAGNLGQRRRLKFMPGDFKYQATKEPQLKDDYDEWLARIICFVFSIAPTPFIKATRSGEAQKSAHDAALEEGLAPLQKYVRNNLNRVIALDFESPDLEFAWVDDREQDPEVAAAIRKSDVDSAIISIDEARDSIGLEPLGGAYAIPMVLTPTGFAAVKSPDEQQADQNAQQQSQQALAEAHIKAGANVQANDNNGQGDKQKPKDKQKDNDADKIGKGVKKKARESLSPHDQPQARKSRAGIKELAGEV